MIQILGLRDDVAEGCRYVEKRPRIALSERPGSGRIPTRTSQHTLHTPSAAEIYVCKLPIDLRYEAIPNPSFVGDRTIWRFLLIMM